MKKLTYNTPHGQLTVNSNGKITLKFESLFMQLNSNQFYEFVSYINSNPDINSSIYTTQIDSKNNFYFEILKNMKQDLIPEFKKLINVPIFTPDKDFDIFDNLKLMNNKQIGVFTKDLPKNMIKVDTGTICPN